jgi:ABC-type nickel/cobalt efflux system permease component RcnA
MNKRTLIACAAVVLITGLGAWKWWDVTWHRLQNEAMMRAETKQPQRLQSMPDALQKKLSSGPVRAQSQETQIEILKTQPLRK